MGTRSGLKARAAAVPIGPGKLRIDELTPSPKTPRCLHHGAGGTVVKCCARRLPDNCLI